MNVFSQHEYVEVKWFELKSSVVESVKIYWLKSMLGCYLVWGAELYNEAFSSLGHETTTFSQITPHSNASYLPWCCIWSLETVWKSEFIYRSSQGHKDAAERMLPLTKYPLVAQGWQCLA